MAVLDGELIWFTFENVIPALINLWTRHACIVWCVLGQRLVIVETMCNWIDIEDIPEIAVHVRNLGCRLCQVESCEMS